MKILRRLLLMVLLLAVVFALAWWALQQDMRRFAQQPMPLTDTACIELERGARLNDLLDSLAAWMPLSELDRLRWRVLARLDANANKLRAGEYRVPLGTSPQALL